MAKGCYCERVEARHVAERLRLVESHPDYAEALNDQPEVPTVGYVAVAWFGFVLSLSFFLLGQWLGLGGLWSLMSALSCAAMLRGVMRARRYARAPIVAGARCIVGVRAYADGGRGGGELGQFGSDTSWSVTSYFVTVEARDGAQAELRVPSSVVATLVSGNVGVAYIKEDVLVAFRCFMVDEPADLGPS